MRRRPLLRLLTVTAIACLAAVSLGGGAASAKKKPPPPKPLVVSVVDFYFGPAAVTIKEGGSVKWVWASTNTASHDVHLKKGPKGLQGRGSYSTRTTAVTNASFKKSFATPGAYDFICTLHPEMKMTVTVKK